MTKIQKVQGNTTMVKLFSRLHSAFRRSARRSRMPATLHNWRYRIGVKLLAVTSIITLAVLVLNRSSQLREAVTLWHDREWLVAFVKGITLPPWAEVILMFACLIACLLAIYEIRTRPPIILFQEARYVVGLRSLDLEFGRIDLEITAEELLRLFDNTFGLESENLRREYRYKSLWVSGSLLAIDRDHQRYVVLLKCGTILVSVQMNEIDNHEHLEKLSKGDRIKLRGRINDIRHDFIELKEAQFAESKRLVSENYDHKPKSVLRL